MNERDRDDDRMLRADLPQAESGADALRLAHPDASGRALDAAADLGAFAPALLPLVLADPSVAEDATAIPLDRADDTVHARFRDATAELEDDETLRRVLRQLRHRAMVRIALREVRGLADVDETSAELAGLAGAALDAALVTCRRSLAARRGDVLTTDGTPMPVVILGMGKLGGEELNPGSDVDICFFYESDDGTTAGDSVHDFFTRLTRRTSAAIGEVTEDGFVFRVDLRLRPEGSRGPLANSLPSAERYYEAFGRTWERAALLRAQPVAGDHALGHRLLDALQPFVYRRAVDPSIAEAMHGMVVRSRRELSSHPERDVKLGRGGIREAEFFVQALQLIWGGRHPEVRSASTIDAARRLAGAGLLTQADLTTLESAWALLRRVEHRIHLRAGYQTHDIPVGEEGELFARSLGFASSEEFLSVLDAERAAVAGLFDSLVEEPPPAAEGLGLLLDACADGTPPEELEPLVALHLPVRDDHEAAAHLSRLSRFADAPLGPVQRLREPQLGALLLSEVAEAADPDLALRGLADFFSRGGAGYGRWLTGEPRLARRLVALLGASPTLGAALVGRTAQLGAIFSGGAPTTAQIQAAHRDPPDEERVSWLRRVKREQVLRIGLAHVAGELDLDAASRLLTALADAQVGFALREATAEIERRLGPAIAPMAVVGMGKLGGEELGFGSDLDLLFLFEGDAEIERQTRVAQATMRFLSQLDAEGPGYETDARLRPSGSQGTLVRSIAAFEAYHEGSAEGWERQALLRARVVAATREGFADRLDATLRDIAYRHGPPDPARVAALRARMQLELAGERPHRYHPKLGYGALVDVEFTTQWLQMRHGDEERIRLRNTRDALDAMNRTRSAPPSDLAALKGAHRFFREVEQAIHLLDPSGDGSLTFGGPRATAVTRRLGLRARDGLTAEEVLEATWRRRAEETRALFERILAPVGAAAPWAQP